MKLSPAQIQMLRDHEDLKPHQSLAHTPELGSVRTWRKLYDLGLLAGGRLTQAGRDALAAE